MNIIGLIKIEIITRTSVFMFCSEIFIIITLWKIIRDAIIFRNIRVTNIILLIIFPLFFR
jgi:hypothetical protein